jgi:serine/threonine protein kinase
MQGSSSSSSKLADSKRHQSEIPKEEIKKGKRLGKGCYGAVYEGEVFGGRVAIKLPNHAHLDDGYIQALRNEIAIMTANPHPNVTQLIGACTEQGHIAIVMELMDGSIFDLLIEENKPIDLYDRVDMARQAALGMNRLHHNNPAIIHRDLKLENMLYKAVGDGYVVKVADFGLGALKPLHLQAIKQSAEGTPLTRAPEIMNGQPFNQKADVYSFGLCLWSIASRNELFRWHQDHSDYDQFKKAILGGERPALDSHWLPSLSKLMEDCWQADPEGRPTFDEIIKRLDDILVEIAIPDEAGCNFWKTNFPQQPKIKWRTFGRRLLEHLNLSASTMDSALKLLKMLLAEDDVVSIKEFGRVVHWFRGLATGNESFLHRVLWLLEKEWFHGHLSATDASTKLKPHPVGTFLVRFSLTSPGGFAVSARVEKDPYVIHYRIFQDADGFFMEGESQRFDNIEDLIEHYAEAKGFRTPCSGSPYRNTSAEPQVYAQTQPSPSGSKAAKNVGEIEHV